MHKSAIAVGLLALLLLSATIFWPATRGPFVFDDFPNLQNLAQLDGIPDLPHIGRYLAAFNGNPGRPLAALSFVIEDAAWPTDPSPYKRNNLLWHLLAGVLVFALCRRMARLLPSTTPAADAIALATTAVWLLHPIQLSSTMLVVQRMNILSTICVLLGQLAYLKCLRAGEWPEFRRVALGGTSLALSAIVAILCKENGILVFAYAMVLNVTLLRADVARLTSTHRRLLFLGTAFPLLLLGAAAIVNHAALEYAYRYRDFTLGERLLTEPRVLVDYLRSILLPRLGGQGLFHDGFPASRGLFSPPATVVCLVLILGLLGSAWHLRVRLPLFAFAVLWFFAGHLIESTVWPLELYFEHRNYLPMVGLLFAITARVATLGPKYRRGAWLLLGVWTVMVTGLTSVNARTWGDRGTLATVWLQDNPRSTRAIQMVASYQADAGDTPGARRTLQAGLARVPEADELAMQTMLLDCITVGLTRPQWDRLVALVAHARNSRIVPDLLSRFGRQSRGGRCQGTMADGGFIRLAEALVHNPKYAWQNESMAYLYYEMARQTTFDRDLSQTMQYLDASYSYIPNPLVAREQAVDLLLAGLPDDAMRYLRKSQTDPQPWIKRKLLNMESFNAPLWESARQIRSKSRRQGASPHPAGSLAAPTQSNPR